MFYFRQSLWSNQPMVYIGVRRNGSTTRRGRDFRSPIIPAWEQVTSPGMDADVVCFTNCERVELFLNGRSLGVKPSSEAFNRTLSWRVPFTPGTLKAVGYNGASAACSFELTTPGKPHHLRLIPEESTLPADGRSLALIRVQVVDEQGIPIYFADNSVTFEVTGAARLRAVDSGDLTSRERFQSDHRRVDHGQCLLIIQSASIAAGTISVRATADGLAAGECTLSAVSR
jgi:beta-galactosidase